jgi:phage tail sheath protein FI
MPFQLSPGVAVVEKDFTSIVPAVSTSAGAFAGVFQWGPVLQPVTISSETELVRRFGKPVADSAASFFTAANFLSYTNNLLVTRIDTDSHRNAVASPSGTVTAITAVAGSGYTSAPVVTLSAPQITGGTQATAVANMAGSSITSAAVSAGGTGYTSAAITFTAPAGGTAATGTVQVTDGAVTGITITSGGSGYTSAPTAVITGNGAGATAGAITLSSTTVSSITVTNGGSGYTSAPTVTLTGGGGTGASGTAVVATGGVKINNENDYLTSFVNGAGVVGEFAAKYPGTLGNSLQVSLADSSSFSTWAYKDEFDTAPGTSDAAASVGGSNDELHLIILDQDGLWTGVPGTILEKYAYVSKAGDAKKFDGTNNYYKDVINSRSQYIWWMDHPTTGTNWGADVAGTTFSNSAAVTRSLTGGIDDFTATDGQRIAAWNIFSDDATYDISLIPAGKCSITVANAIIALVETRKDCMAFFSPEDSDGAIITSANSQGTAVTKCIAYRNALTASSYAVLDSGYKYQYDRYNDKYRYVPLNGDIAGLCARTDYTNDAWWSPGGLNRGQIKNVVKLAISLDKTDRDNLYKNGVNPVVTFPGDGTVLFGDKTLLAKPSAFDRINVRRLFIVLEKAIATAAKYQLFEFNDGFTRAQFKNLVEPFLRDVQGRRGITDFVVKCDDSNNTGEVIDRNEFVADIFIKPARSINFITLNFVAARSGINFSEIGG